MLPQTQLRLEERVPGLNGVYLAIPSMIKREVKRESPSSSSSLCDDLVAFLSLSFSLRLYAFSTCITNSGSSAGRESARCRNTSEYKAGGRWRKITDAGKGRQR